MTGSKKKVNRLAAAHKKKEGRNKLKPSTLHAAGHPNNDDSNTTRTTEGALEQASCKVFTTVELVQNILSHVPTTTLLDARCVSSTFRAVIDDTRSLQQELTFESSVEEESVQLVVNPYSFSNIRVHPLYSQMVGMTQLTMGPCARGLSKAFVFNPALLTLVVGNYDSTRIGFNVHGISLGDRMVQFRSCICNRLSHNFSGTRPSMSVMRAMQLTKPPATEIEFRWKGQYTVGREPVYREDGVTFGDIIHEAKTRVAKDGKKIGGKWLFCLRIPGGIFVTEQEFEILKGLM